METYYGHVRTPADAIILFEACRIGLLPRVQRRLSEKERQSIRSGSVFVWDEREAGMRRWTDGKSWSASRVSGSFLTYREMEGKRGGGSVLHPVAPRAGKTPDSTRGSDDDRGESVDDGPDGYRYKPDGLMKQSFSITTSTGQHLHLISYYSRTHPSAIGLPQPSTDPALRHVRPQKGLYPESTVNDQQNLPVVTRGPMPGAAYPITPHPMGGYARAAVAHPPSYAPTYAWPLTPLPTPPSVPMHYGPPYLPPLSSGQAQYAHHSVHQSLPPPPPPLPPSGGVPHSYDRPYPGEATAATAPPPPAPTAALPPAGGYANRSPRGSDVQPPYQRSPPGYGAAPSDRRTGGSPRTQSQTQYFQQQANGTAQSMHNPHDPKLGVSPYHHGYSHPQHPPPPPQQQQQHSNDAPKSKSTGNTVPSIGALMNGAVVPPPSSAASSPRTAEGPRDIPSEKIAFGGEDIRALRQLDRVFTA